MTRSALIDFFMWCTILNAGMLMFSFLMIVAMGDFVHKMHSRWFPMSREAFYTTVYAVLGVYKMLMIAFSLVPWLALVITS